MTTAHKLAFQMLYRAFTFAARLQARRTSTIRLARFSSPSSFLPSRKAASADKLFYPDPPTTQHADLDSFLAYASRTGLDTSSTVYIGTHYEYTVGASLARYGLDARRVGGASDFGIDLLGVWSLPSQPQPLRVILQCKGGTQKIGPSLVRELEGSFVGAPPGWRAPSKVLAFLVSEKPATKGVRDSLGRSAWPMGYISCSRDGLIKQMIWNHRAEEIGLEGVGVSVRHTGHAGQPAQLVLTWEGKHLLPKEALP